jgi:DNA-binding beta-propeller fold protein YncE
VSNGVAFNERGDLFLTDTAASRLLQVRSTPGHGLIGPGSRISEILRLAPPFETIVDNVAAQGDKAWFGELVGGTLNGVDLPSGELHTLAGGDGTLPEPRDLAVDVDAGKIYLAVPLNDEIVTVDLTTGAVAPFVDLPTPFGGGFEVHLALSDGLLFVSNNATNQVHVVDTTTTEPLPELYAGIEVFPGGTAGDGGPATAATLAFPQGIAVDSTGKLLIAELYSGRVRVVGTSDLEPGVFPNVIRADSDARVELAIEGNPELDATDVVPSSVRVAGARTADARLDDTNGDHRIDLVVKVRQSDLARGLDPGAREAAIEGRLHGGHPFHDADWVTVLP